jgi:hypothetical protein
MNRASRLFSDYLADGRFAQVLAPELAQLKAAHRERVAAGLAEEDPDERRPH